MADFDTDLRVRRVVHRTWTRRRTTSRPSRRPTTRRPSASSRRAIFTKEADGKIKIVNTTSTTRSTGAKWGVAVGAVAGRAVPAERRSSVSWLGPLGALSGNLVKGWGAAELKTLRRRPRGRRCRRHRARRGPDVRGRTGTASERRHAARSRSSTRWRPAEGRARRGVALSRPREALLSWRGRHTVPAAFRARRAPCRCGSRQARHRRSGRAPSARVGTSALGPRPRA